MVVHEHSWFPNSFTSNIPSCVFFGIEIYNSKTCDDIYGAFNWIFFGTYIMLIMIMCYRVIRTLIFLVRVFYFKIIMPYKNRNEVANIHICQSLLSELNLINDKYYSIWNKKTKAEVFDTFSRHKEQCKKCRDRHCVKNTLRSFFKYKNPIDLKENNEVKLLYLNDNYSENNCLSKNLRKDKRMSTVTDWFAKQVKELEKLISKRDNRKTIHNKKRCIKYKPTNQKINTESNSKKNSENSKVNNTQVKRVSFKDDEITNFDSIKNSILSIDDLRKEISLSIDEIQSTLSKNEFSSTVIGNQKNIDKSTTKIYNTNRCKTARKSNESIKQKSYYCHKNLNHVTHIREYPEWLFENQTEPKITLITQNCVIDSKKDSENLSKTNTTSTLNNSFSSADSRENSNENINDTTMKKINLKTMINKPEESASSKEDTTTESLTNKDNKSLHEDATINEVNDGNNVIEPELKNKTKSVTTPGNKEKEYNNKPKNYSEIIRKKKVTNFKQETQIPRKINRNLSHNTNFQTKLKDNIKKTRSEEINNLIKDEIQSQIQSMPVNTSKFLKTCHSTHEVSKLANSKLNPIPQKSQNQTSSTSRSQKLARTDKQQFGTSCKSDKDNTIKDEIINNIVNIPQDTATYLKNRYKVLKCNKDRHLNVKKNSSRLDVIFEH